MGALAATVGAPRRVFEAPRRGLTVLMQPGTPHVHVSARSARRPARAHAPVRHGTCRLIVIIDGTEYRLTRSPAARAAWHLKRMAEPREGAVYYVLTHKSVVTCTCPDSITNGAVCKHVRALKALGLVARRARPEAVRAARNLEGGAS